MSDKSRILSLLSIQTPTNTNIFSTAVFGAVNVATEGRKQMNGLFVLVREAGLGIKKLLLVSLEVFYFKNMQNQLESLPATNRLKGTRNSGKFI